MKYILLCGGIGSRYNNYSLPKPLNYIHGKHMIEFTIKNIPSKDVYIIYNVFLNEYMFKETVVNLCKDKTFHFACIDYTTRGAVESAHIGIQQFPELIDSDDNIVFIDNDNLHSLENMDNYGKFDSHFIGYGIDRSDKTNFSFIEFNHENNNENDNESTTIIRIEEKLKISDYFCCGLYGFVNTQQFIQESKNILLNNHKSNNEFYFSQLYKSILLNQGIKITPVFIEKTQHIGSYTEISNDNVILTPTKLRVCFDLDNTLVTYPTVPGDYSTVRPITKHIALLNMMKDKGYEIIIYTARRMNTHKHNVGKVIKDIALVTIQTLETFSIYYDELIFGKPIADIYIDDKSLNPYITNISHYGFFTKQEDFLQNKIDTNKYNSVTYVNNTIIKSGPTQYVRGELYFYQHIPSSISHFFPKLLDFKQNGELQIQLTMEYIKGIPLFYLYKNKLITEKIIDDLLVILHTIHTSKYLNLDLSLCGEMPNEVNVRNNYLEKIKKRFENKTDYYFNDADIVYKEIVDGLEKHMDIDIRPVIHGDFWFSNIILMYDDSYKLLDMKGQVDGMLTVGGDRYYDYGKLYQSILGYDLILHGLTPDIEYLNGVKGLFIQKCTKIGLNIPYLSFVTKSLIFGTFTFIDASNEIKENVWELLKSIE